MTCSLGLSPTRYPFYRSLLCRVNTLGTTESCLVEPLQPRLVPITGKQKISADETVLVLYTSTFEAVTSFSSRERIFYRTKWNTIQLGKYCVPTMHERMMGSLRGVRLRKTTLEHFQARSRALPNSTCGELIFLRKISKARFIRLLSRKRESRLSDGSPSGPAFCGQLEESGAYYSIDLSAYH